MIRNKLSIKRTLVRLRDLINLNKGTDHTDIEGSLKSIKDSIQIRGANIWILVCGSFLAAIGLDTNSPTLLIGAMLISPLMIPVLGIGVFYATNDIPNLKRSSKKILIALGVSLISSLIYFILTPFGEVTHEINIRTHPTLLDAFIAFIGGVVGIISFTRKEHITVLPGVAVSITLMPPVCVMGYGISQLDASIFNGAFYLLLINALIIIFVSSFAARLLGFPLKKSINLKRKKLQRRLAIVGVILLLSPGTYLFSQLIAENKNEEKIKKFIDTRVASVTEVLKWEYNITDSINEVEVFLMEDILSKDSLYCITESFNELALENTELRFIQPKLEMKDEIVDVVDSLSNSKNKKMNVAISPELQQEIKEIFPDVESIARVGKNSNPMKIQVKWAGIDLFVPRRKRKLTGIKKYLESNYHSEVTLIQ